MLLLPRERLSETIAEQELVIAEMVGSGFLGAWARFIIEEPFGKFIFSRFELR